VSSSHLRASGIRMAHLENDGTAAIVRIGQSLFMRPLR
jgi:hypothetical protein